MRLPPLSILEVAPVEKGRSGAEALSATVDTVRTAEKLGFRRAWFAEHHGAPLVASVAPAVLSAHSAAKTSRLRVGAGGVLLPNHSPRAVAEQFATLDALHPGRIDLGIGRGPGTFDASVVAALQRGAAPTTDDSYRTGIVELLEYLSGEGGPALLSGQRCAVQPWLLSSSVAGAALAGELGLPAAVAHHIRPQNTVEALDRYRETFRPSRWSERPYVMIAVETICADTDTEVSRLVRPLDVIKAGLLEGRADQPLLPPAEAAQVTLSAEVEAKLRAYRGQQALGTPAIVAEQLATLAASTGADEVMLSTTIYGAAARQRSLRLLAKATDLNQAQISKEGAGTPKLLDAPRDRFANRVSSGGSC